jgi:hypothetical protein
MVFVDVASPPVMITILIILILTVIQFLESIKREYVGSKLLKI